MSKPVTRSDVRQVAVNMVIGCVLIGLSAVAIDRWPRGEQPTSFGRLEFPITDTDRERAAGATAVRDGLDAALSGDLDPLDAMATSSAAVLDALIDGGFLDTGTRADLEGTPLRIRLCADRIGVVVESAVQPEAADNDFWTSNTCGDDRDLVRGAFVAVTTERVEE